jgi:hypothetical protein
VPGWRTAARVGLSASAVAVLAAAMTACGGSGASKQNSAASTSHAQSSTSPSAGPSESPSAGGTQASSGADAGGGADAGSGTSASRGGGSGIGGQSAANRCTAQQLGIKLGQADVGAGNIRYRLTFTNNGSSRCSLHGFPGVSLLQGDGQRIGRPAKREGNGLKIAQLAPGQSASATLHTLNRGVKGGGCWKTPALLQAYPPGSKDAMTLRTDSPQVCGDTFEVSSLQ